MLATRPPRLRLVLAPRLATPLLATETLAPPVTTDVIGLHQSRVANLQASRRPVGRGRSMWTWALFVFAFIASMLVAGRMAHERHRSARAWVWIAAILGPFGPLALYVLGDRPNGASHA
jgi:hypothetical protein